MPTLWTNSYFVATTATPVLVHNCDLDALSASGKDLDPADAGGQLTRAGRAYAKHANLFPQVTGGPAALNKAGHDALDEILTNPGTIRGTMQGGNFAGGKIFIAPSGIGAVYNTARVFQYFGRFPYP